MKRTSLRLLVVASGILCMAWGQEQDQNQDQNQNQEEGPGRGVARISMLNGDVSVRRGDSGELVAAALNAPLVVQDQLLTGAQSRAEVQFDGANMVRVAAMSEVRLAQLDNQRYQLQLARGMVTFRVLRASEAQIEISTPSASVRPVKNGSIRITVREDGTSEITVRSGEAEIFTPRGSERLQSGQTMLVRGTQSDPEFQASRATAPDDWDRWNENRDRELGRSQSYNYMSRDIYGAEDLDANGSWANDPSYGYCWYPRVADDWAPYRQGRWSWVDWYGWSWVSSDPWGWAPYHYGRWFRSDRYGWGWWPGERNGRHYWSPGLVAFVGWNSWGGVGWIPLAPHERYYPWYGNRNYAGYRNGGRFGNGIHVFNNVNIANTYRNARVRNAITGVDSRGFVNGRGGSAFRGELRGASLVRGVLPVTPGRESLRLSDRAVRMGNLPSSRNEGRFVSRQQPARVDRISFDDQRRGMDQMTRRAGGLAGGGQRMGAPAGSSTASGAGGGGGRATQSSRPSPQGGGVSSNSGDGWQRFNQGAGSSSPRTMDRGQYYGSGGSAAPRYASPRNESPRSSSQQVYRGGGQAPVRINPPIMRERTPNYGGGSYSRPAPSGGGGSYSRPAPSGGGGGSHGGGGGGSRSSGGGGGGGSRGGRSR